MGRRTAPETKEKSVYRISEILPLIGEFGRFQKILLAILFTTCLPASLQILLMYFSSIVPSWKCIGNSSICIQNGTMPADDLSRCNFHRSEWYYTEPKGYSLATEFDLDCGNEWLLHLASSMLFIGWGFGALLLGWAGDVFGRLSVLYPSITVVVVVGFCLAFVTTIYQVMICQFIIGLFIPGTQLQAFILISELVEEKYRPFAGILVYLTNPVGWCILALKAYFIRNWRILAMVCTAPYIFIFGFWKFVPESIKWLHLHGKKNRAKKIILKISQTNKKEIPANFEIMADVDATRQNKANPLVLFSTCFLSLITLVQGFLWMAIATCYYGLHMAADDLDGSVYRDFIIINIVEIPALSLAIVCCNYFGRKRATLIPSFVGSLICIAIAFIPTSESLAHLRVVMGVAGDFFMTISFNAIYPWSVEIYPLYIRNEGMGFLQVVSHWGSASAPWIVKGLKRYGEWCPFFTLGAPAFVASLVALWLRETKEEHIDVEGESANGISMLNERDNQDSRTNKVTRIAVIENRFVESREAESNYERNINDRADA